eukprot:gnl/TRDRNA2_/TRDRNA2_160499_c5_seq1.p1 gnl/TRDRNA2_/TRDRNA2_160499_c5~~gnl/TRDRNA2_/TRDRNA2_160499_c5_seq1.p1  ORF type:complete len:368 (+),score=49.38 gnl/TRDRNA2_/TRDRNA2_160499_c5_seq1:726-1829(+)
MDESLRAFLSAAQDKLVSESASGFAGTSAHAQERSNTEPAAEPRQDVREMPEVKCVHLETAVPPPLALDDAQLTDSCSSSLAIVSMSNVTLPVYEDWLEEELPAPAKQQVTVQELHVIDPENPAQTDIYLWSPPCDHEPVCGVVITARGAGPAEVQAGRLRHNGTWHRADGPHCLFNRLAWALPMQGVAVLHPLWNASEEQGDMISAVKRLQDTVRLLHTNLLSSTKSHRSIGVIFLGFSMGGAAVIEAAACAAGRDGSLCATSEPGMLPSLHLHAVATIGTQSVGVRDGSLRRCVEWLALHQVPLLICVGTADQVLPPECSEQVATWGRSSCQTKLVRLVGDGHSCRSAWPNVYRFIQEFDVVTCF